MSCPKCGGTSGVSREEWQAYERFRHWGEEDTTAEALPELEIGKWVCMDCDHRFNKDPFATPAQREGS